MKGKYKQLEITTIEISIMTLVADTVYYFFCKYRNVEFNYLLIILLSIANTILISVSALKEKKKAKKTLLILFASFVPAAFSVAFFELKSNIYLLIFILSTVIIFFLYYQEDKKKQKKQNEVRVFLNTYKVIVILLCVFSSSFLIMNALTYKKQADDSLIAYLLDSRITVESQVSPSNDAKTKENSYLKAYLKTVSPLVDGTWKELSSEKKIDVYQTIVNIEASYNGFSKSIKVCFADISDSDDEGTTYGEYNNETSTIYLNEAAMNTLSADECLFILFHEVYHAYQHQLIDIYNSVDDEYKQFILLNEAAIYYDESQDYKRSKDDYEAYKSQKTEITADSYGYKTAKEYINLIEKYLNEDNER